MDPPTVNCRGITLLKIPEPEGNLYVSIHQLSGHLSKLFKVTQGAVYNKLNTLGITLSNCSKETVVLLRKFSVVRSYKASKLTLKEAEKLFDAFQVTEQRRGKRERAYRRRRWLQKMGTRKKNVDSGANTGQISPSLLIKCRKKDKILSAVCTSNDFQKGQLLDGCVLYGGISPQPMRVAKSTLDYCELESEDEMLEDSDCISKLDPLIEEESPLGCGSIIHGSNIIQHEKMDAQAQPTTMHTIQCTPSSCSNSTFFSSCIEKDMMNGYQRPPLHRTGYSSFVQKRLEKSHDVHGNEEDVLSSPKFPNSPLSDLSENSATTPTRLVLSETSPCSSDKLNRFIYVTDSTDEDEKVGVLKKHKRRRRGCALVGNSSPSLQGLPKKVIVTKLRHFAKTTSPKMRTTAFKDSMVCNGSIGKHLPLSPPSTPSMEISSSTVFSESLLVSIPRSKLNTNFDPVVIPTSDICSSHPLTPFGKAPSTLSKKAQGERVRMQRCKVVKPKALSVFVSKKRAITRTPSPMEELSPANCLNINGANLPQDLQALGGPHSYAPKPGKGISGKVMHAYPSLVPKSHPSMRSGWSPLDNGCKEPKGIVKHGVKKPRKENRKIRGIFVEQAAPIGRGTPDFVISEDDRMSVTSSSTSSNNISSLPSKADPLKKTEQCSVMRSLSGGGSFSFDKLFDTLHPKLVVVDDELRPELSLSLRGLERSKCSDIPPSHPVWTWRLGQTTIKGATPYKVRSNRHRSAKSKPRL